MKEIIKKGSWVEIKINLLSPEERDLHIPKDTKKVPLVLKTKGFLKENASIGDKVKINTIIDREIVGELVAKNPCYNHGFGKPVEELIRLGKKLRKII